MSHLDTGILLPQSTLTEPWFVLLSTVVAFNTIIYVGLTLSKLIPWPHQFHPSRVRGWLSRLNPTHDRESPMTRVPVPRRDESPDPYENLRRTIARRDIPQAFALVGGVVIVFAMVTFLTLPTPYLIQPLAEVGIGLLLLVTSQVLARRDFRGWTMMWTWTVAALLLVGLMLVEAWRTNSQIPVAYALIVMTAYAPIVLAWRPSLIAGGLMFAAVVILSKVVAGNEDGRIITLAGAAILVSWVLLQLRLAAIDEIADERARSSALATTDVLTGRLTRTGLITLLPPLAATAERTGQQVCVMAFDIDGLARANSEYGVLYGDDVIKAVGDAIASTVRQGDLVARWGGDEFLVAGLGAKPSAPQLATRVEEAVRVSGINLGKWPTTVSVRTSSGDPRETTFDALVNEALVQQ
jgi:diguanylate cyclase (GGDEF)-like protein